MVLGWVSVHGAETQQMELSMVLKTIDHWKPVYLCILGASASLESTYRK